MPYRIRLEREIAGFIFRTRPLAFLNEGPPWVLAV
jgi:hypothetical protein